MVSPDVGNVKVAEGFANLLGGDLAIINKRRISGSEVAVGNLIGSVEGKTVLMFDDMISTAGTVCNAAKIVEEHGAVDITVAATHGLFVGPAIERLQQAPINRIVVSNTLPIGERILPIADRVEELNVAKLFADAIDHIHHNKSVSSLFRGFGSTKR